MSKFSLLLLSFLISFTSCQNAKPIPKDKESYLGLWISHSGFQIDIKSAGTASITQIADTLNPDFSRLNIKVAPAFIKEMIVEFRGDSILLVRKPLNFAKEYLINRSPYQEGDTSKLVLNGVMFIKQK
jgi:hypothetical protein